MFMFYPTNNLDTKKTQIAHKSLFIEIKTRKLQFDVIWQ